MTELLRLQAASKVYTRGNQSVRALDSVDLTVREGEFVAVTGPSGSGKSTLLHILGCLEQLTSGRHFFAGVDVGELSDTALSALRARKIGFVFQAFHLLPGLNVVENVLLPGLYRKLFPAAGKARELLDRLGLGDRCAHFPNELSGGEMQRVAIARALTGDPDVLLADEPTGNLDQATSAEVLNILKTLHKEQQMSIILVTHDPEIAAMAQRQIQMRDGRVAG